MANITWTGVGAFSKVLNQAGGKALDAMAGALYRQGEIIMTKSKRSFVPVDLGTLRASGFVEKPVKTLGRSVTVTLGYGGAAKKYALIVHEDRRGVVPRAGGQGGPKYLERPFDQQRPIVVRAVARAVDETNRPVI